MWRERIGTALIVVILTGSIWLFADRASREDRTIKLALTVEPANGDVVVLGQDPSSMVFDVTVRAPRGVIGEIEDETQGQPFKATFKLDENVGTGSQPYNAAKTLSQLNEIKRLGLSVTEVRPENFTLDIDRLVRQPSVRIKPEFRGWVVDVEEPAPDTCSVILPRRLTDDLTGSVLPVDVSRYIDPSQPETWITRNVDLRWPQDVKGAEIVRFEPATVSIRFRLKDTTSRRTFETVQVTFNVWPDMWPRYTASYEPGEFRPTIIVSGPKQRIDSLDKKDVRLFVEILPSDVTRIGQEIQRRVSASLPPGVQVEGDLPIVRFTLQEQAAGVGG